MDEFLKFVATLPNAFSKDAQEELFCEYIQSRDFRVRDELILHNLRLCAKFAIWYAEINNKSYEVEDIYSESIYAMEKAVDNYRLDIDNKSSFSHFAWKYMSTHLLNLNSKNTNDAAYNVEDLRYVTEEGEELPFIEGVINDDERDIVDDVLKKKVVSDVKMFVDSWDDENLKIIIKKCLGLDGTEGVTQAQLCRELNIPDSTMSVKYNKGIGLVRDFITSKYGKFFSKDNNNEIFNAEDFHERNEKIFNAYYGLNGYDAHLGKEIVEKFKLTICPSSVLGIVYGVRKKMIADGVLSAEDISKLDDERERKLFTKEIPILSYVYNSIHGLNGCEQKSLLALSKELNMTRSVLYSHLKKYEDYLTTILEEEIV